ncbi:DNA repair helicase and transcription factor protein [Novymonas esmeraldas]|uniref:DNA 3'-5' helicase n=1 Tax=Novymonas esmeraldas TaxID=1808958 RepID=A0AAW0EQ51_9TRYP
MNIGDSGNIFVEKAHPAYTHVIDFLVSCCEPVSRTQHMEEYRIDSSSLSAATAEGTYSLAMMETILRHFRLSAAQELPVDLERVTALERLAAALDESNLGADMDDAHVTPVEQDAAAASASFAAQHPLPRCLHGVDCAGTALAAYYSDAAGITVPTPSSPSSCAAAVDAPRDCARSAVSVKVEGDPCGSCGGGGGLQPPEADAVTARSDVAVTHAAAPSAGAASPTAGRVLQLLRPPSSPSPSPSLLSSSPPPPKAAGAMHGTARPLIALAVVRPADVQRPLPVVLARLLAEEEGASRVQIVLQPRLRRYHRFESSRSTAAASTPAGRRAAQGHSVNAAAAASAADEEGALHYFVQSRQRAHLELVLPALKPFLEPVVLHGAERWILSDVDRSPLAAGGGEDAARVSREGGRPAVLRLLYAQAALPAGPEPAGAAPSSTAAAAAAPSRFVFKCQVQDGKLREVKVCLFTQFGIRADCYYDYVQDRTLHVPNLNLASHVRLRPYQVASLERFRRGRKAHHGVVVLPCGAGKTLTGIGAAATLQSTTIVMCVNNMSVFQWRREFLRWTDLSEDAVTVCTSKVKQRPGSVFITTYSMVIAKRGNTDGAAAEESRAILQAVASRPWGLLLLDEVHTALAHHFQDVLNTIKYKCVLGLSATLLREDEKIGDLRHLVGPKLYEANWLDLTRAGFLARVECAEVQCPMPPLFLHDYRSVQRTRAMVGAHARRRGPPRKRRRDNATGEDAEAESDDDDDGDGDGAAADHGGWGHLTSRALRLSSCNPYKLWCTQALLAFHQQRSPPDKVIIFCDYLADVRFFAHHLHLPFMDQRTSEAERSNLLQYFQHSSDVNAVILTRVGDVALDLPCASVVIQVSGLGASRRQEAQRLGRILRPKPPSLDNTCAYFYSLVSQDTADIRTGYRRQSWLRDQGFAYRILHSDRVLSEFARVGGRPCCVGPPQWWYQTPTAGGGAVHHDGLWWSPFSDGAADLIEAAFQRGRAGCTLRAGDLGTETTRPPPEELGQYRLQRTESWTVTFSSVDAPLTFGTVLVGEAAPSSPLRERRLRRGCLDPSHRCTSASASADTESRCIKYARGAILRVRDGDAAAEADEH